MPFNFKEITEPPLIIANVWDVASSKTASELGFKAIGTSSGAIAEMLGYEDGEKLSFDELLYIVKRITSCVSIPLNVDIEAGYSREPIVVVEHIQKLADLGITAVNIEDSVVKTKREIQDPIEFSRFLDTVSNSLIKSSYNVFLNVRTDTYLLNKNKKLEETIIRSKSYQNAGAHGLFVPCLTDKNDIKEIAQSISLPLNVMCMPDLPDFKTLYNLGVQRISMGNFIYKKTNEQLKRELDKILINDSFKSIFKK